MKKRLCEELTLKYDINIPANVFNYGRFHLTIRCGCPYNGVIMNDTSLCSFQVINAQKNTGSLRGSPETWPGFFAISPQINISKSNL